MDLIMNRHSVSFKFFSAKQLITYFEFAFPLDGQWLFREDFFLFSSKFFLHD